MFYDEEYQKRRRERLQAVDKPRANETEETNDAEVTDADYAQRSYADPKDEEEERSPYQRPVSKDQEKRDQYLQRLQVEQAKHQTPSDPEYLEKEDEMAYEAEHGGQEPASDPLQKQKKRAPLRDTMQRVRSASTPAKVVGGVVLGVFLLFFVIGLIATVSFFRDRANQQISPRRTAQALVSALNEEDYERYRSLFPEGDQTGSVADLTMFNGLRESMHANATVTDYVLIRQANGRDLLIALEYNEASDQYEIYDVQVVPNEARGIFVY